MKKITLSSFLIVVVFAAFGQEKKVWSETDRTYLQNNLVRSRDELVRETEKLTQKQWDFKESPDRWSIREIVEHIGIWELLMTHEISRALAAGVQPDFYKTAKPDSVYLGFITEEHPHITTEYTKPFTYSVPMGRTSGADNVAWVLKMRNESIEFIKTSKDDLRSFTLKPGRGNIHQVYITLFGHTDRHLRQIRKVKSHPKYPK